MKDFYDLNSKDKFLALLNEACLQYKEEKETIIVYTENFTQNYLVSCIIEKLKLENNCWEDRNETHIFFDERIN